MFHQIENKQIFNMTEEGKYHLLPLEVANELPDESPLVDESWKRLPKLFRIYWWLYFGPSPNYHFLVNILLFGLKFSNSPFCNMQMTAFD